MLARLLTRVRKKFIANLHYRKLQTKYIPVIKSPDGQPIFHVHRLFRFPLLCRFNQLCRLHHCCLVSFKRTHNWRRKYNQCDRNQKQTPISFRKELIQPETTRTTQSKKRAHRTFVSRQYLPMSS